MKSNIVTDIKFILELNEFEAGWLKAAVQNPLCKDESIQDAEMRSKIWHALEDKNK